jgi:hypothetical protein
MHRSGTSAVTGVVDALGLHAVRPDDRMHWPESNPEHWESASLSAYDDNLLERLGGSWEAPPDLVPGWEQGADLGPMPDPGTALSAAFPGPGPFVWKDPRLCLLLPFWRRVLTGPLAALFIWRAPTAVARSLQARDGMEPAYGVALWERYNRAAIDHLAGLPTYVANYETLLADPGAFVEAIGGWLRSLGTLGALDPAMDTALARSRLEGGRTSAEPDDRLLVDEQRALVELLSTHAGPHPSLDVAPPGAESGWTTAMIRMQRQYRSRELVLARQETEVWKRKVAGMTASTSWRVTAPLRALTTSRRRPPGGPSTGGDTPGAG